MPSQKDLEGYQKELYLKGEELAFAGKTEEALECFEEILKVNPNQLDALVNGGVGLVKTGRLKEALKRFEKALDIAPTDVDALQQKAETMAQLGMSKKDDIQFLYALKICEEVSKTTPNLTLNNLMYKRIILNVLDMTEEELKIAKKIAELDPDNEDVKEMVRQIESDLTLREQMSEEDWIRRHVKGNFDDLK